MNKLLDETIIPELKEKIPSLYSEYGENTNGSVTQKFMDDTFNQSDIAIGKNASKTNSNGEAISIGVNADTAESASAVIIGPDAKSGSAKTFTTALGNGAKALADCSTALGNGATVNSDYGIAIGSNATNDALAGISLGLQSDPGDGVGAIAIGYNTTGPTKTGSDSVDAAIAIGFEAKAENQAAVALGYQCDAKAMQSIAIGKETKSLVYGNIAMGIDSTAGDTSDADRTSWPTITGAGAIAIGNTASAKGLRGISLGTMCSVPKTNDYGIAIGHRAAATHEGSIVLNSTGNSLTSTRTKELRLPSLQIGGVANGTNSDDAVNKSQLDAVEAKIPEVASSVETIETDVEIAKTNISTLQTNVTNLSTTVETKQDKLTSGTNIKTVNNTSVLGSGNITVQPTLVSGTNIKTINGNSLLGSGDLAIAAASGGATIEKLTTSNGESASGSITIAESTSDYDLLIINATACSTIYSDVAAKNITYTQNVNAIATVDYRYGTNNQYAFWSCRVPSTAEVQYFKVPRQVAVSVSIGDHYINLQLNVSSTTLMMNEYRDWENTTYLNPTNVVVYGIKFGSSDNFNSGAITEPD